MELCWPLSVLKQATTGRKECIVLPESRSSYNQTGMHNANLVKYCFFIIPKAQKPEYPVYVLLMTRVLFVVSPFKKAFSPAEGGSFIDQT